MVVYSIIIPHKNSPDLLQYCLDSIPIREDIQVIVVDDNSSADIVEFDHFPRWRGEHYEFFLTHEGKGTGYARNFGLDHVKGKWVLFLDADDYFLPTVSDIFDEERETDADIVFFRPVSVMLKDRQSYSKRAKAYNAIIDRYFSTGDETELRCRFFITSSRFINHDLIKKYGIRCDEIEYSNDNLFSVKIGVNAKKIAVRDKSFYCFTESSFSLTSNFMNKPGELQIRTDAFFRAQAVVHEYGYPVDEKLAIDYLRRLFSKDRKTFILNFNRMRELGYTKMWLLRHIFKENSIIAAFKRSVYTFIFSEFGA